MSSLLGPEKKIAIVGSSGFVGARLLRHFRDWQIATVDRNPEPVEGVTAYKWDGRQPGDWCSALEGVYAVINLAGSPISVKWTEENRKLIVSSRVDSTRAIGEALEHLKQPPKVWVNASATGYYGDRADTVLYENAEAGRGFLSDVCQIWEKTAMNTGPRTVRRVLLRTGFALGREGGAFKPIRKLAALGLGGAAGSGNQWMPWIHIDDLCRMYRFVVENDRIIGPVNGSAPEPVRNREFMARLRQELSRPWSPPAPAFALKLLGEVTGPSADLLLGSQRAVPRAAIDNGFSWTFPNVGTALVDLIKPPKGVFVA